jgi:hypothetical protein
VPNTQTATKSRPSAPKGAAGLMLKGQQAPEPHVRQSQFSGRKIVTKLKENPRRADTFGHASFEIVLAAGAKGISYEDYRAAGGRPNDLQWDLDHDYVTLK